MVDHQRLRELFEGALDVEPDAQSAYVSKACAGDLELEAEVLRLLRHDERAPSFLNSPISAGASLRSGSGSEWVGYSVDGYEIVAPLARGGMGLVLEAVQKHPSRRVALKTLQCSGASDELVRRMRIEAEVLGLLNHPGIAQVYGAGTLGEGGQALPYIAMEFVEGARSLGRYADARGLDGRARLRLFQQVCGAVEHGHRKGIVHRDLKPGNLLVNEDGEVKVIDFGLARVTAPEQLDISVAETLDGGLMGTLEFMSPEHVTGRPFDVDVRSDIYSLGCVLYELLCGQPPRDFAGLSIPAAVQRLQTEDPVVPRELPREQHWILTKALERRPEQRYASVRELSEDIERHLCGRSVHAVQPTAIYQLAKFSRRHRGLLLAVSAVLLALALGFLRERRGALVARQARDEAQEQRELARGVSRFLRGRFVTGSAYSQGPETTIASLIEESADTLDGVEGPLLRASLASMIGEGLIGIGRLERAREILEPSLEVLAAELPDQDPELIHAQVVWVDLLERLGEYEASLEGTSRLLELPTSVLPVGGNDRSYLTQNMVVVLGRLGRYSEAEQMLAAEIDWARAQPEPDSFKLVLLLHRRGDMLLDMGRAAEAIPSLQQALELAEANAPSGHPFPNVIRMSLGSAHGRMDDLDEAEALLRKALVGFEAGQAPEQNRMAARGNLLTLLIRRSNEQGAEVDFEELKALLRATEEGLSSLDGEPGRMTIAWLLTKSGVHRLGGEPERAVEAAERALELGLAGEAASAGQLAPTQVELAKALREANRPDEALAMLESAVAKIPEAAVSGSAAVRDLMRATAESLRDAGSEPEGLALLTKLLEGTSPEADDLARTYALIGSLKARRRGAAGAQRP